MTTGVNTKLATVIERLDTIIEGLTGHADLLEVLQDVHTDTQSMDGKLLAIRDEQADIHLDTQSMDLKLLAIRDEQADIHLDTQSIDSKLLTVRDTLADIYTQVLNLAPGSFDWEAVLGTPTGSTDNILAWLAQTIDSLGLPTGDATTTVLGRLSAIETLNFNYLPLIAANTGKCPCGASPPPEGNICAEPYISTGMALVPMALFPNFNSVTICIWATTPPTQLEYGTVFGTYADNSSIVPSSGQNWTGRSIFVETSADNFALQTLSVDRYPTNTWVDLTPQGTAEISVMVDPGAAVRAYICPDNGGGGGGTWGEGGGGGGTWGVPNPGAGECYTILTEHSFSMTKTLSNGNNWTTWDIPEWADTVEWDVTFDSGLNLALVPYQPVEGSDITDMLGVNGFSGHSSGTYTAGTGLPTFFTIGAFYSGLDNGWVTNITVHSLRACVNA